MCVCVCVCVCHKLKSDAESVAFCLWRHAKVVCRGKGRFNYINGEKGDNGVSPKRMIVSETIAQLWTDAQQSASSCISQSPDSERLWIMSDRLVSILSANGLHRLHKGQWRAAHYFVWIYCYAKNS